MNITINIPQLDGLTAAINALATSYSGGTVPTEQKKSPKADAAGAAEKPASPSKAAPAKEVEKEAPVAVDAGSGEPLDTSETTGNVQPEGEQKPLTLTPQSVKTMAAKLTMMDGGSEKLATILKSYGAAKFSEVPADKLADFAGDLIDAGAPTE